MSASNKKTTRGKGEIHTNILGDSYAILCGFTTAQDGS